MRLRVELRMAVEPQGAGVSAARVAWPVAVIAPGISGDEAAGRLEALRSATPAGTCIEFGLLDAGAWRAGLSAALGSGVRAVLVIGTRAAARVIVPTLVERCEEVGVGVLLLLDGDAPPLPVSPGQHVVDLRGAEPGAAAGALAALAHIQPALAQSVEELRLEAQVRGVASRQLDEQQVEEQLAVMVQREFLPKNMPATPGLETAVLFRPRSGLSGDFYDVARLDEHHTAFFLADACGHGVPAALLMMLMSKLLPMKEISGGTYRIVEPAEALSRLNQAFAERKGDVHALVSAVYGVVDGRDGTVRLASAGHPPAVVLGAEGVRTVDDGGPLLGTFEELLYTQCTVKLEAGDVLVVHSDGVPPALGLDEATPLSTSPIVRGVRASAETSQLSSAMESFRRGLDARAGSLHQHDDLTVLMLRRLMPAASMGLAA